ncbi:MerR family transcriptional regulator [Variovorax sp. NFACC27]|uniref:MerR family transcriptional regulator n=1 Tax=unclassified Variovorax TaxID=663243 RepID=UPI000898E760|nr:DNA-binding transcriptional regulator, MerR family [Variovorax sp. NFACC28]SEG00433.1 DNA-binding transcriptional regulator, MerR family [Variovorax sp. NFACC29]SFB95538.1 DNA-binding transcriptional regulator, MerR family [Variovorax sp. NFACC26]SFF80928.1 DNA-binding transcriptional regulator, MerR family [Variovorax sp. NFACC27]
MLLKVGELARHTGLTVRTLHHYDAIGLLAPSARSEAGYRLYDAADVARLHAIQALRLLGLPLAEIGALLGKEGGSMPAIIARQIESLDQQIAQATALRERLGLLQQRLDEGAQPDMKDWLDTLEKMTTYGRYFSPAEIRSFMANWKTVADRWPPLVAEVAALMSRGVPASAPEVQPLAARWMMLMGQWMDGSFDLITRWGEMYRREPVARSDDGPPAELLDYIGEAIGIRMAALLRHLTTDDLAHLSRPPEDEWRRLAGELAALKARGVPPDDERVQTIAREWARLFDAFTGHDPGLAARLMQAMNAEPVLQAAAVTTPEVRDYLLRAMAVLQQKNPPPTAASA